MRTVTRAADVPIAVESSKAAWLHANQNSPVPLTPLKKSASAATTATHSRRTSDGSSPCQGLHDESSDEVDAFASRQEVTDGDDAGTESGLSDGSGDEADATGCSQQKAGGVPGQDISGASGRDGPTEAGTIGSPQQIAKGDLAGKHSEPLGLASAPKSSGEAEAELSDGSGGFGSSGDEAPLPPRPPVPAQGLRRRSGIQSSPQEVFQGLKARFDAMERLDLSPSNPIGDIKSSEEDLEYIRLLKPPDFVSFLRAHRVPVSSYGQGQARSIRDLWAEVVIRECNLVRVRAQDGTLTLGRSVRILVLELCARVGSGDRYLLCRQEKSDLGLTRDNLDARATKKMFDDEDIPSAVQRCLLQTLGVECSVEDKFGIESAEDVEEVRDSTAYPGLTTTYTLHVVRMRVRDPSDPCLGTIGLPSGSDFAVQQRGSAVGVGRTRSWFWCSRLVLEEANKAISGRPTSPRKPRRCKTLSQLGE